MKDAKSDVSSITATISDLISSSSELTQMGRSNIAQKFDFNEVSNTNVGGTGPDKDGTIVMDVTQGKDANYIHEATHGYAQYKGTESKDPKNIWDREVTPYQRQFSFDPSSINSSHVPSVMGSVSSRSDVTPKWVSGINDAGNFIYAPGATTKIIKDYWITH